jgi:hypothetical protein
MKLGRKVTTLAFLGALAALALAAQSVTQLTANGQIVSGRLAQVHGQLMVPVSDVATYFGYSLKIVNGTAQLTRSDITGGGSAQAITPLPGSPIENGTNPPVPSSTSVTPPSVTAPMTAQPLPSIPTTPGTVIPGTAVTTANAGLFPSITTQTVPTALTADIGGSTNFNGFDYQVVSVTDAGQRYRTVFDQRHQTIRPSWKTDRLVAVNLAVTNRGTTAILPPTPAVFGVTVFDDEKIGYPVVAFDMRQMPEPSVSDDSYDLAPTPSPTDLLLGPGGTMRYAVIASIPQDRRVTQVQLSLPGGTTGQDAAGATVSVRVSSTNGPRS